MTILHKFKKIELDEGGHVARPIIPVRVHGEAMSVDFAALLDSGCDTTTIPYDIAELLGLKLEKDKMTELFGFLKGCKVYETKAQITFVSKHSRENITLIIPVVVPEKGMQDDSDIVLGIRGVFDNFKITFDKQGDKIILKKYNKPR